MKKEVRKKKGTERKVLKAIAFSEMFVMILASFAFAFIFSAGMIGAESDTSNNNAKITGFVWWNLGTWFGGGDNTGGEYISKNWKDLDQTTKNWLIEQAAQDNIPLSDFQSDDPNKNDAQKAYQDYLNANIPTTKSNTLTDPFPSEDRTFLGIDKQGDLVYKTNDGWVQKIERGTGVLVMGSMKEVSSGLSNDALFSQVAPGGTRQVVGTGTATQQQESDTSTESKSSTPNTQDSNLINYAIAQEKVGNNNEAGWAYEQLAEDYMAKQDYTNADKYYAKAANAYPSGSDERYNTDEMRREISSIKQQQVADTPKSNVEPAGENTKEQNPPIVLGAVGSNSAIPKVTWSAKKQSETNKIIETLTPQIENNQKIIDEGTADAKAIGNFSAQIADKKNPLVPEQQTNIQESIERIKTRNGIATSVSNVEAVKQINAKINTATSTKTAAEKQLKTAQQTLKDLEAVKPKYSTTLAELTAGAAVSMEALKTLPPEKLKELGIYEDIVYNKDGTYNVIKGSQQYTFDAAGNIVGSPVDLGIGAPSEYSIFGFAKTTLGGWGHLAGSLVEGLAWAGAVITAIKVFESIGLIPEKYAKPLYQSLTGGIIAGKGVYGLLKTAASKQWINPNGFLGGNAATIGFVGGALVAYLIFSYQYKEEKTETKTLTFKCMSWQAPRGGEKCGECNKDPMKPCSEYRCKALGQSCELLNKGTGQEKCEWVNRNDAISPGIKPWNQVLTNGYVYAQVKPRPAGGGSATSGMVIQRATDNANGNKCIDPYTPIEFGILTYNEKNQAEPAQCKIEYTHKNSFSEMGYYFGDSNLYLTNHSQKLSMPSISSLRTINENESEGLPMEQTPGEYTFYVRCADANGNENRDEFAVRFCIDEGPDMTAPTIKGTNFGNQTTPVPFGQDNLSIEVYTNEPAKCFWEREDRDYTYMGNEMTCSNTVWEMNAELLYTCHTTLTSIEDRENNEFFFRCVDLAGNAMQEGYQFTVIGTQPLDIIATSPNGTIAGSTSVVKTTLHVETANGYNNGESRCFYSPTGENSSYIEFFYNTSEFTNVHDQILDLGSGTYAYYFRCIDLGGNSAMNSTTFTLETDRDPPLIVRAYNENNQLLVITDESSDCRYTAQSCSFNFNDGLIMSNANSTVHEAEWKEQNYYIKCADGYNNQPYPTECSIVVRPYLG